jgi:hypothetical protein
MIGWSLGDRHRRSWSRLALIPFLPYIVTAALGISRSTPPIGRSGPDVPLDCHSICTSYAALAAHWSIGTIILLRPKGRGLHKALGWSWVIAMAIDGALEPLHHRPQRQIRGQSFIC